MSERENSNAGIPLPHNEQSLIICKSEATEEEEFPKTVFFQPKIESELDVAIKLPINTPVKQERDETLSELTLGEIVDKHETAEYFNEEQQENQHCEIPASNDMFKAEEVTYLKIEDNETLDFKIFKSQFEEEVETGIHSLDVEGSITIKEESEVDFGLLEKKVMPLSVGENKINKLLLPLVAVATEQYGTICKEEPEYENQMCSVELKTSTSECINEVAIKKESAKILVDLVPKILSTNLDQVNLKSEQKPHYKSTDLNASGSRNSLQKEDIPINKTTCKNCGMQIEDLENLSCDCNNGQLAFTDDNINAAMPLIVGENKGNKLLLPLVAVVTNQSETSCKEEPDNEYMIRPVKVINFSSELENEVAIKKEKTDILVDLVPTILYSNSDRINLNSEQKPHFKSTDLNALKATGSRNPLQRKCSSINKTTCKNCGKQFEDVKSPFCDCSDGWLSSAGDNRNAGRRKKSTQRLSVSSNSKQQKRTPTRKTPFACSICNKRFSYSSNLVRHKIIHTGETPYMCSVCNKRFSDPSCLIRHKRIHTGETPFTCSICNKRFYQFYNLVTHKRIHTGETPYTCSVCNKSFTRSSSLVRHKRIHTGETPYTCSVCNKSFARSSYLASHKRIHTGETPYTCSVCNKSFTRSSYLVSHKRIHTGQTPYTCSVCNKRFSYSSHLVCHKRIHTGETPYTCSVCNKSFNQSFNLAKHKRRHVRK